MELLCPKCSQLGPGRPIEDSPHVVACNSCGAFAHLTFTGLAVGTLGRPRTAVSPSSVEVVEAMVRPGSDYRVADRSVASLLLRYPTLSGSGGRRRLNGLPRFAVLAATVTIPLLVASLVKLLVANGPVVVITALVVLVPCTAFALAALRRDGLMMLELVGSRLLFDSVDLQRQESMPADEVVQLFCGRRRAVYESSEYYGGEYHSRSSHGWCFELRALRTDGSCVVLLTTSDPDIAFFAEVLLEERLGIPDRAVAPPLLADNLEERRVQGEPLRTVRYPWV